jgi:hypothetical protein
MKRGGPIARRTPLAAKRKARTSDETSARRLVAARSQGVCEACGQRPASEWAHRVGKAQGGPWSADNGLHLCGPDGCHLWCHHNPEAARALGWMLLRSQDPLTVPVQHARYGLVLLTADGGWTPVEEVAA